MLRSVLLTLFTFIFAVVHAQDNNKDKKSENKETLPSTPTVEKEDFVETTHEVKINGATLSYTATAGTMVLKEKESSPQANIFFVSYTKNGNEDRSNRPITFCFNGGPGSSSVWLHLGVFGPQRVLLTDKGEAVPPYRLVDNEFSLLDVTDLVFIDPVSTGFSRAVPPTEPKHFHGFEEDVKSVAEFIKLYLSRFKRWDSPKFIAGESYGTTRAVGLANYLHEEAFIYMDGVILISAVLDFQSVEFDKGTDLGYLTFFPSYTATAWYYKKLPQDLQSDFNRTLNEVKQFVQNEYAPALFKGNLLPDPERNSLIEKLSRYTTLPKEYFEKGNLRVSDQFFMKKLLENEDKIVGRFDSRYSGYSIDPLSNSMDYDPSAENILGAFTATFNQYVRKNLNYDNLRDYKILTNVCPWDFGNRGDNKYLQVASALEDVMIKNENLQVFIANGYYDLATPFYCTEYMVNHLNLPGNLSKNISMHYYDAGHMMYVFKPSLIKFKTDLNNFYKMTLNRPKK